MDLDKIERIQFINCLYLFQHNRYSGKCVDGGINIARCSVICAQLFMSVSCLPSLFFGGNYV